MDAAVRAADMDGHPKASMGSAWKKALKKAARNPTKSWSSGAGGLRFLTLQLSGQLSPHARVVEGGSGRALAQFLLAIIRSSSPSAATCAHCEGGDQYAPALQPERIDAEGAVPGGAAEALILSGRAHLASLS